MRSRRTAAKRLRTRTLISCIGAVRITPRRSASPRNGSRNQAYGYLVSEFSLRSIHTLADFLRVLSR